jgi:hypothetical protein
VPLFDFLGPIEDYLDTKTYLLNFIIGTDIVCYIWSFCKSIDKKLADLPNKLKEAERKLVNVEAKNGIQQTRIEELGIQNQHVTTKCKQAKKNHKQSAAELAREKQTSLEFLEMVKVLAFHNADVTDKYGLENASSFGSGSHCEA